ncbi:MAG TPA: hypothetical protein P5102_06575 [Candidatus Competibacteraceae bacterium]|nr:hypothetical protein [Candidatus Competibacteraceae bacterium]HSA45642.1 hypothetical protein [Candidatus Competibacteraceae bacterium]
MMYREPGTGDFIFTNNDDDRDEAIKELGKMDSDYCDKVYKCIVARLGYVPDEDEDEDILDYIWNFSYESSSHQYCRITCPKYPEIEDAVKRYFDE